MPIHFVEYVKWEIEEEVGTPGGTTFYTPSPKGGPLNPKCFAYMRSHVRAVKALTGGRSGHYQDITDEGVAQAIAVGAITIDDTDCLDKYGWLGVKVYDGDTQHLVGILGDRCDRTAGYGTAHLGYGRCKQHGGEVENKAVGRLKHGMTSKYLSQAVQDKIQKYMADPDPSNITQELAKSRALAEITLEMILEAGDPAALASNIPSIQKQLTAITEMADRLTRIEQRYALTAGQIAYVQSTMVQLINTYIPDPRVRDEAAKFLMSRLAPSARQTMLIGV